MKITCILCDRIEQIDEKSLLAKKYRNHPLRTHLCTTCRENITVKTIAHRTKREMLGPDSSTHYI